jgi:hypothetical protein
VLVPADVGESASVFLAKGWDGSVRVLKTSLGADDDSTGRLRELVVRPRAGKKHLRKRTDQ